MESSKEWKKLMKEYLPLDEEIKALEKRKSELKQGLKTLSQGRSATGHGGTLVKSMMPGFVDYSKIPQLQGVDLEPYRKPSFEKWEVRPIKRV
jgi:hypothetical protein